MAARSSTRIRILSNYVRLLSSFALGLILVRLLLGIGEQAYGLIALLGAGTGIASAIKEVVRASMVPELGAAYHSDCPDRFRQTYNAALMGSPVAALITVVGFTLLAVSIRWVQVPEELVWAARVFVGAKAIQTFVAVCLAPTFNMYMVTERMVAYNVWIVVERLAEVSAAAVVVVLLQDWPIDRQIATYASISAGLAIASLLLSSTSLMRKESELRPRLGSATISAAHALLRSFGWNAAVVLAMNLYTRVDMFIMNAMFGLMGNLVFGIASQLTFYVRQLTMGVVAGVDAVAARLASDDNDFAVQRLVRQSTRLQAIIVFPATFGLMLLAKPLIVLWIGARISDPATTALIVTMVRILMVGIAARSLSEGWMRILAGAGHVRLYAPTVLVAAVANPICACVLIYLFYAGYEWYAPAVVFSCLLFLVHLVYIPFVVARRYEIGVGKVLSPLVRPLVAALVGAIFLVGATRLLTSTVTSVLVCVGTYSAAYAVACYAIVLESSERHFVTRLLFSRRVGYSQSAPHIKAQ